MTVLEVIQRSTAFLSKKEVDSPRLQAELLLAHVLGLPRMQLYLNFERVLTPTELESYRELIARRGKREPLQLLLGSTCFCGLEIEVNRHTLIPRPETELLAEQGWTFLNRTPATTDRPATVLDFGTGTGCLAVTLAVRCPAAQVWALDCSAEALTVASRNAARHAVSDRIHFVQGNALSALGSEAPFTLIISNPPYIPSGELPTLQPEVRDFEPHQALDGGADGLDFYRRLAAEAGARLKPSGKIMVEFGDGQSEPLRELFASQNWIVEEILEDYTQRSRILVARKANRIDNG